MPELYDHQHQAVTAAIAGRDVLVIAPTGSGKLESFVGSGLVRGGLTVIVSPLRSLIADQSRRLEALGLPFRVWNSDVKDAEKAETLDLLRGDWAGFLLTTPESLKGRELSAHLAGRIELAVVDEAHCCLRDRGFRVSYAWLGATLARLRPALKLACTATMPAANRAELIQSLRLDGPVVIVQPVARSNLAIHSVERDTMIQANILNQHRGRAGIVFAATVRTAERLYGELLTQGRNAGLYHGRLAAKAKRASQAIFMSGKTPTMITTDSFILGINKSDIRFIVHYDYPKSIEDWTQGFGRAGRDGLPADVYGCFRGASEGRESRRFLLSATYPPLDDLRRVWEYLIAAPFRDEIASSIGERALGYGGKYAGPTALTTLQRYRLATADVNPADRRRRLYRGVGNFDDIDWTQYHAEKTDTFARFDNLCELGRPPTATFPAPSIRILVTSRHPPPAADARQTLEWRTT